MALVAAFAIAAFPAHTFASTARTADYGKAAITVVAQSSASSDGKPIAGATVELVNSSGVAVSKHVTDSSGRLSFAAAAGSYKVRVSAPGYQTGGAYLDIKNGQTTYLTIRLQPVTASVVTTPTPVPANDPIATPVVSAATGKAEITVVSAQPGLLGGLQGVAGATVVIYNGSGAEVAKLATDSAGQLRTELAEGNYTVSISADGYQTNGAELTIKSGQTTYLTLQLTASK